MFSMFHAQRKSPTASWTVMQRFNIASADSLLLPTKHHYYTCCQD